MVLFAFLTPSLGIFLLFSRVVFGLYSAPFGLFDPPCTREMGVTMLLSDFDYELPPELIAHAPSAQRDQSRLMVLRREQDVAPKDLLFQQLGDVLRPGDLLVMNDTRVLPSRLDATKSTGGKVELLLVAEEDAQNKVWEAMARASRPLRVGMRLQLPEGWQAEVREVRGGGIVLLALEGEGEVLPFLEACGRLPLPPYIDASQFSEGHRSRYQTVYAKSPGAVAAPTAGLHFTNALLAQLQSQGITLGTVTLHVGLGTFLPVRVEQIDQHKMHTERYMIPSTLVEQVAETRKQGGRVIAVGTTSLRALEASAQKDGSLHPGPAQTDIFIRPGFLFHVVDGLLTNFHLPRSTLLMLVAAFHGRERILHAYNYAISKEYRFFSYGDAMCILS